MPENNLLKRKASSDIPLLLFCTALMGYHSNMINIMNMNLTLCNIRIEFSTRTLKQKKRSRQDGGSTLSISLWVTSSPWPGVCLTPGMAGAGPRMRHLGYPPPRSSSLSIMRSSSCRCKSDVVMQLSFYRRGLPYWGQSIQFLKGLLQICCKK